MGALNQHDEQACDEFLFLAESHSSPPISVPGRCPEPLLPRKSPKLFPLYIGVHGSNPCTPTTLAHHDPFASGQSVDDPELLEGVLSGLHRLVSEHGL